MNLFRSLFVWWRDATWGTLLNTWLTGVYVGADACGNRYYRSKTGDRRWVLYRGSIDASRIPSEWHGWLHHSVDLPPDAQQTHLSWRQTHLPNLSGTRGAYHPCGSLAGDGKSVCRDYEPWRPS